MAWGRWRPRHCPRRAFLHWGRRRKIQPFFSPAIFPKHPPLVVAADFKPVHTENGSTQCMLHACARVCIRWVGGWCFIGGKLCNGGGLLGCSGPALATLRKEEWWFGHCAWAQLEGLGCGVPFRERHASPGLPDHWPCPPVRSGLGLGVARVSIGVRMYAALPRLLPAVCGACPLPYPRVCSPCCHLALVCDRKGAGCLWPTVCATGLATVRWGRGSSWEVCVAWGRWRPRQCPRRAFLHWGRRSKVQPFFSLAIFPKHPPLVLAADVKQVHAENGSTQ